MKTRLGSSSHGVRGLVIGAAMLAAAVNVPSASAATELRYRYVANGTTGGDLVSEVGGQLGATGDEWSVDGIRFKVRGRTFDLTVDDAAMTSPLGIPVRVIDHPVKGENRSRTMCLTDGERVTIRIARPNSNATVLLSNVGESSYAGWGGCYAGSGATTGTLTISR